jgi:hypothetical protein
MGCYYSKKHPDAKKLLEGQFGFSIDDVTEKKGSDVLSDEGNIVIFQAPCSKSLICQRERMLDLDIRKYLGLKTVE